MGGGFTIVYTPLKTHPSHGIIDHDTYMHSSLFALPVGALDTCPPGSNVSRLLLEDDYAGHWENKLFTLGGAGMTPAQVGAMWARLEMLGLPRGGASSGVGFLLRFPHVVASAVNYASTGALFRYMRRGGIAAGHAGEEAAVTGVLSGARRLAPCGRPFIIGVHVRRGDIMKNEKYKSWRLPADYFSVIVQGVLGGLPRCLLEQAVIVVYTEGNCCELDGLFADARRMGAAGGYTLSDGSAVTSLLAMARSDVLVTSFSAFSRVATVFTDTAVVAGAFISVNHTYEDTPHGAVVVGRTESGAPIYDADALNALIEAAWAARCTPAAAAGAA